MTPPMKSVKFWKMMKDCAPENILRGKPSKAFSAQLLLAALKSTPLIVMIYINDLSGYLTLLWQSIKMITEVDV